MAVAPKETSSFMGPEIAAAGISGLAGLVGGLFSLKAEEKRRKQEALTQGLNAQLSAQQAAATGLREGSQNAFQQLMQSYQGVLR